MPPRTIPVGASGHCFALVVCIALLLLPGCAAAQTSPTPASAPQWPASAEDEADRLGRFLDDQRDDELRTHWGEAIGALAIGVPQIALGYYMQSRTDVAAQAIGPGLVVGGIADCVLGIVPLLVPTPLSRLHDLYRSERDAGKPADQVVSDVEQAWVRYVSRQRTARRIAGLVELGIAVPAFATGLVFALSKPGLAGMSDQTQYGWAGGLLGFDFLIYQGIVALVAPPPVDTAFETYELLKHGMSAPRVGVIPVRGGAALGIGETF